MKDTRYILEATWEYETANWIRGRGGDPDKGQRIENSFREIPEGMVVTRILYWDGKPISISNCFVPRVRGVEQ